MDIHTKCDKCFFKSTHKDIQVGCDKGRLSKWLAMNKAEMLEDEISYTISAVCNTYCESAEHADHIDKIIFPTCDMVIISTKDNYLGNTADIKRDILHTCKRIMECSVKPSTITIVCDHSSPFSYSELTSEIDLILGDVTHKLIVFVESKGICSYIDEATRKTKGRYIYTVKAGDTPKPRFMEILNRVENIDITSFLAITDEDVYSHVLMARCGYEVVDKNKNDYAITKLKERAKTENLEHMILSWNQLQ